MSPSLNLVFFGIAYTKGGAEEELFMLRVTLLVSLAVVMLMAYGCSDEPLTTEDALLAPGGRPLSPIKIYVTSQELCYDSIPGPSLPMKGPFQQLFGEVPDKLWTEFGPGSPGGPDDPGYVGGRWWIDNPDEGTQGEMDIEDTFFVCPLLGPGYDCDPPPGYGPPPI